MSGANGASGANGGAGEVVLRAEKLAKTFRLDFFRKPVEAVKDVSFEVRRGEVFGFLGPNGAGKTTTLKMLMGLVTPTRGRVEVLGRPVPDIEAKRRLGYLPESPYFYEYLTAEEFLDLVGALFGLRQAERRQRRDRLIERVGLDHARGRPLRKFSKGMLQRVGIAQALMGEPELVVLDEPMTGLDPLGRKEIRDLILELKHEGRTVMFSTHILPDVEMTCDRVAMVFAGRLRNVGPLADLVSARLISTEVDLVVGAGARMPPLPEGARQRETPDGVMVELPEGADVDGFLRAALAAGAQVMSVFPRKESLEDIFVREAGAGAGTGTGTEARG
jgi:ABC-2 type transport system ATP-binding protein